MKANEYILQRGMRPVPKESNSNRAGTGTPELRQQALLKQLKRIRKELRLKKNQE